MKRPAVALMAVVCLALSEAAPTQSPGQEDDQARAEAYLSQFYSNAELTNSSTRRNPSDSFEKVLERMQEFYGLEVTGQLDSNTLEVMRQPRCGVPDVARFVHIHGKPRWKKNVVTYRITKYTSDLSKTEVDATIAQAFKLYSDVIPLDFKQITKGTADIMILFQGGSHGDFHPFDGPSGVLGHANSPGEGPGGDAHFDEDETWTLSQRGINLLLVAAHEFGHALGLDHSRNRKALLYPTYKYVNTQGYQLPKDDRRGVQALYGIRRPTGPLQPNPGPKPDPKPGPKPDPKPDPKPNPKPDPKPDPAPERCNRDLVFDAATSIRGELYFFKNGHYWKKSAYVPGIQLHTIKSTWPEISSVDAAYEFKARDISYLFQGTKYWGTRGTTALPGYPKSISNFGFPSHVRKIDSAVHVASLGKSLFFEKHAYWSFNERTGKMDPGYPRYISIDFPGIGSKVDAAFENAGYLYFSDGARQTEYQYSSRRVNRVLFNYGWLNCY